MTTYHKESVVCGCCGAVFSHNAIASTNTYGGFMDLDTRPPEMMRSTMTSWVQQCPKCGFAGEDVSDVTDQIKGFVQTTLYQAARTDTEYPELARAFICSALIAEQKQEHHAAGMMYLRAAWSCDDTNKSAQASKCRMKTVEHIQVAVDQNINNKKADGSLETIIVDCLRRCGEFDRARKLAAAQLSVRTHEIIREVLAFQIKLIERRDTGCHRAEEASPTYVRLSSGNQVRSESALDQNQSEENKTGTSKELIMESTDSSQPQEMKQCPYCAEEIRAAAIKCKHCGEFVHCDSYQATDDDVDAIIEGGQRAKDVLHRLYQQAVAHSVMIVRIGTQKGQSTDRTRKSNE